MQKHLLLLHGALGSKVQLDPIAELVSEAKYTIHTLTFEGHGTTVSHQPFSIALFVKNVLAYMEENKLDSVDVFGYSMGGYVALQLALNFPERVDRIMTLGTKFDWSKKTAEKEVKLLNPEKIETKVPKFAKRLEELHGEQWKEVTSKTGAMMLALANGAKFKNDDLRAINKKVLINIGAKDHMVTLEETENVAELLPNATMKILKDIPHPIDMISKEYIANMIQDFMHIAN